MQLGNFSYVKLAASFFSQKHAANMFKPDDTDPQIIKPSDPLKCPPPASQSVSSSERLRKCFRPRFLSGTLCWRCLDNTRISTNFSSSFLRVELIKQKNVLHQKNDRYPCCKANFFYHLEAPSSKASWEPDRFAQVSYCRCVTFGASQSARLI